MKKTTSIFKELEKIHHADAVAYGFPAPKYSIGQTVKCPPTLYNEKEGKIVDIEKIFQEVNKDGTFNMDGLATLERTIQHCCLPCRFDGKTLEVDHPESTMKLTNGTIYHKAYTRVSKFYGYAYTIQTKEMRSLFNEEQIKLKK